MKPKSEADKDTKRGDARVHRAAGHFPRIDFNYHATMFGRFHGGYSGKSKVSFLNISRDYFRNEARWNYLAEVLFFLLIIATAAVPLISGARAVWHFLGLPSAA